MVPGSKFGPIPLPPSAGICKEVVEVAGSLTSPMTPCTSTTLTTPSKSTNATDNLTSRFAWNTLLLWPSKISSLKTSMVRRAQSTILRSGPLLARALLSATILWQVISRFWVRMVQIWHIVWMWIIRRWMLRAHRFIRASIRRVT